MSTEPTAKRLDVSFGSDSPSDDLSPYVGFGPPKRTWSDQHVMSQKCQEETSQPPQIPTGIYCPRCSCARLTRHTHDSARPTVAIAHKFISACSRIVSIVDPLSHRAQQSSRPMRDNCTIPNQSYCGM